MGFLRKVTALMHAERFIENFSQQALDKRISLFLGAGCSCDAGYPNWTNLYKPFAES